MITPEEGFKLLQQTLRTCHIHTFVDMWECRCAERMLNDYDMLHERQYKVSFSNHVG